MTRRVEKAVNVYKMYISMWPKKVNDARQAAYIFLEKRDVVEFNKEINI